MSDSGISSASKAKRFLWDLSGAFGDIGVLFPIAVALIAKNQFNPTALFLMAGIFYVASAWYFRITMPVQPLKVMAAIAIATGLGHEVISAAGIIMGIVLIFVAVTGLSVRLGRIFPVSVIRGIQLGLGAMLVKASFGLMWPDFVVAILAAAILLVTLTVLKKIPPLIPLLALGIVLSIKGATLSSFGPVALTPVIPDLNTLGTGFMILVLPQIALTFGNAVVATSETGRLLYGDGAQRLTLRSIPMSMGIANIASGIAGGVPMCHGCGGLTAHCKFGASSERSGYIIGFVLISLALMFGHSALSVVSAFPSGILGVLLCYVGIQHSLFMKDIVADKKAVLVALSVAVAGFLANNLTIGFIVGLGIHYSVMAIKHAVRV